MIPTEMASELIAFAPEKTSIWRGIRIAKAKNPESSNNELKRARNTLIGHNKILDKIQFTCDGLKAVVNNPALELLRKVPARISFISTSKVIL